MRPIDMNRSLLCVVLSLIPAACAAPVEGPGFDPTESVWELESGSVDGGPIPMVEGYPITLSFEDDSAGGTAACNGYGGSYTISGNEITFSELIQTEMACTPEETMASERAFLGGLTRVESFSLSENILTLSGDGVELVFIASPT